MIVLDEPYVPQPLLAWCSDSQHPVLDNDTARAACNDYALNLVSADEATWRINMGERVYTNSENALDWITSNVDNDTFVRGINMFKDKVLMRSVLAPLNPNLFFQVCATEDLFKLNFADLPVPFVVKPSAGFVSLGVHIVRTRHDWDCALEDIRQNAATWSACYPPSVVNTEQFILESYLEGTEYAIDVFFDEEGKAQILNILRHDFASSEDTSDRMYVTSPAIIREMKPQLTAWLNGVNALVDVRNFPAHIEVRVAGETVFPIEFNPLRFMGLGGTDITLYGYGYRTYEAFLDDEMPDFEAAFAGKDDKMYTMSLLNAPEGITGDEVFDYEALAAHFTNVLYMRAFDVNRVGAYGYIFLEVDKNTVDELEFLKTSDLKEFLCEQQG